MTNSSSSHAASPAAQLPVTQQLEDLILAGGRGRWRSRTTAILNDASLSPSHRQLASTTLQLQSAQYATVLASPDTSALLTFLSDPQLSAEIVTAEWLKARVNEAIDEFVRAAASTDDGDELAVVETRLLFVGIALLQAFVSVNWTGLALPAAPLLHASADDKFITSLHTACHSILSLDGEDVFDQSAHPHLLTLAHLILVRHSQHISRTRSAGWWTLRLLAIHHAMMETNTATIKQHLDRLIPATLSTYAPPLQYTAPTALTALLAAKLRIELSALQLEYWQYDAAETCLETAQSVCGLSVSVTGVMGKRTKWQQDKKSQLVVTAEGNRRTQQAGEEEAKESKEIEGWTQDDDEKDDERFMPGVQQLDSDVLLTSLALDQQLASMPLSAVQRALLLALSNFLTTAASTHITLHERQLAYLHTILATHSQRSWSIEQSALYHQSILELDDKHKQDRALQQLEDMCQLRPTTTTHSTDPDADAAAERRVRMEDVYVSGLLAVWRVKLAVGGRFERLGLLRSALDLYNSMGWMDGIIEMNVALQRRSVAEQLIQSRLTTAPTPKLYCLLADLTGDISPLSDGRGSFLSRRIHVRSVHWLHTIVIYTTMLPLSRTLNSLSHSTPSSPWSGSVSATATCSSVAGPKPPQRSPRSSRTIRTTLTAGTTWQPATCMWERMVVQCWRWWRR